MAPHSPQTRSAVITFNAGGDNTVIAAVSGASLKIYGIVFTVDAGTNVTFKDTGGTSLTGAFVLTSNGSSFTLPMSDEPWVMTTTGTGFVINQSGTANFGGIVWYTL